MLANSEEALAKKLCKKTFADYVMFQNIGQATEAAIKVARRYFFSIGKQNKNRILCIKFISWKNNCRHLC